MIRSRLRHWCSALGLGASLLLTLSACGSTSVPTTPTVSASAQALSSPFTLYANGQPVRLSIPQNLDPQTTWAMTPSLGSLVGKGREGVYTLPSGLNERTTVTLLLNGAGAQVGKQFKLDLNLLPQSLKAQSTPTGPAGSTLCAGEGGTCDFTGQRLVAYGADSTFTYKVLEQGTVCNNLVFGDPRPGMIKDCFIADPTPTVDVPQGYIFCATENTVCKFDGSAIIAYGAKPNFQVLTLQNGTDCTNVVFGDPINGASKNCYIKAPAPEGYTFCSLENQKCDFSGTRRIAYGANNIFNYLEQTDGTACKNSIFGDPIGGVSKACYLENGIQNDPSAAQVLFASNDFKKLNITFGSEYKSMRLGDNSTVLGRDKSENKLIVAKLYKNNLVSLMQIYRTFNSEIEIYDVLQGKRENIGASSLYFNEDGKQTDAQRERFTLAYAEFVDKSSVPIDQSSKGQSKGLSSLAFITDIICDKILPPPPSCTGDVCKYYAEQYKGSICSEIGSLETVYALYRGGLAYNIDATYGVGDAFSIFGKPHVLAWEEYIDCVNKHNIPDLTDSSGQKAGCIVGFLLSPVSYHKNVLTDSSGVIEVRGYNKTNDPDWPASAPLIIHPILLNSSANISTYGNAQAINSLEFRVLPDKSAGFDVAYRCPIIPTTINARIQFTHNSNKPVTDNIVDIVVNCRNKNNTPAKLIGEVRRYISTGSSTLCYYSGNTRYDKYSYIASGEIKSYVPLQNSVIEEEIVNIQTDCAANSDDHGNKVDKAYRSWVSHQFSLAIGRFTATEENNGDYNFYIDCGAGYYPINSDYCYNYNDWARFMAIEK